MDWNEYLHTKQLYLPPWMREWEDQKQFFKVMHEKIIKSTVGKGSDKTTSNIDALSWMDLHVLVVDRILFYLATHGYEIRKVDNGMKHLEFKDDYEKCIKGNPAFFWGGIPDFNMTEEDWFKTS
jgi:hypothetical protein